METHLKFNSTAIVIVEIDNEGKAPETRYITIGSVDKSSEESLEEDVLSYLKEVKGLKKVKSIIYSDSEKYRNYLENAISDFANQ